MAATNNPANAEANRARVVEYLYHQGTASRAQVAKALSLTAAAITKITARLIEEGIVHETGGMQGMGRRRSIGLAVSYEDAHVVGVKFARSLVEVGVFDLAGRRLRLEELPPVSDAGAGDAIARVHATVGALIADDPAIRAVGMAVPGPYLRSRGHTAVVSSMQRWGAVNFPREFADAFGVPATIE
ncbi:MAG: NagC family transcriptional regulator, partial [Bifidobacterium sp.]|nr:NagC family transcriptional regulator [Bifidobacterium sp.]